MPHLQQNRSVPLGEHATSIRGTLSDALGLETPFEKRGRKSDEGLLIKGGSVIIHALIEFARSILLPTSLFATTFFTITMKFTTAFSALALAAVSRLAAAVPIQGARDVWDPRMTYPNNSTVWTSGQTYTVTWLALSHGPPCITGPDVNNLRDTSDQPTHITNTVGLILLRFGEIESPGGYHFWCMLWELY